MKRVLITFLIIYSFSITGQENNKVDFSKDWEKVETENSRIEINITEEVSNFDLSPIWITNDDFPRNGAIGTDFQRIQVNISSVIKDIKNPLRYVCQGKSNVKGNLCDFSGEIVIQKIYKYDKVYSLDDTLQNAIGGSIVAYFKFLEDKSQSHTGTFKGIVKSYWYLDTLTNKINYNELETFSDSYENNTFVGTWTSYKSQKQKLCIWGDYRLPYTDGLYIGAGDIIIGDDYKLNGWQEFTTMWTEREKSKEKKNKWWK